MAELWLLWWSDFLSLGQLYDGYDEEYKCPILDEDRVSEIMHSNFKHVLQFALFRKKVKITTLFKRSTGGPVTLCTGAARMTSLQ